MSTSITELSEKLKYETQLQQTSITFEDTDYLNMVIDGLKRLYVDTARYSSYNTDNLTETDDGEYVYSDTLPIDEEEYVLICAQLSFYNRVKAEVNALFGYTTDALTVTNADKPYANMKDTIDMLEKRRRELFYRMVRYTMG